MFTSAHVRGSAQTGSIESNYSVCPCPLHWFYAFLHQTEQLLGTPFSVNLHQFTGDGRGGKGEG